MAVLASASSEARERGVGPVETTAGSRAGIVVAWSTIAAAFRALIPGLLPATCTGANGALSLTQMPLTSLCTRGVARGASCRLRGAAGRRTSHGFERSTALDESCGEQPLGAVGNRPPRARRGISSTAAGPVRARHRAETHCPGASVVRVLFEDVGSLAGPSRHWRTIAIFELQPGRCGPCGTDWSCKMALSHSRRAELPLSRPRASGP